MKYNKAYEEICDKYHVSDYGRVAIQQFFQTQHEAEIDALRSAVVECGKQKEYHRCDCLCALQAFDSIRNGQVKRKDL